MKLDVLELVSRTFDKLVRNLVDTETESSVKQNLPPKDAQHF